MNPRMSEQEQAEARRRLWEEGLDTQWWLFGEVTRLEKLKLAPAEHQKEINELGRWVPPWDPAWEFLPDKPQMRWPKKARDEAKRRWQLHEEERKWREAEIAKLEKSGQLGTRCQSPKRALLLLPRTAVSDNMNSLVDAANVKSNPIIIWHEID
jgi:hypothetical protein